MSDTASVAPATEATPSSEMPKDVSNAVRNPAEPKVKETPKAPQRYKFGTGDGAIELDEAQALSEIQRGRQSGKLLTEAQKRLEASNAKDKTREMAKRAIKSGNVDKLAEALDMTHEEAVEVMSKYLYEKEIKPKQMSPEQQKIAALEARLREVDDLKAADEKGKKDEAFKLEVQQSIQKLKAELEPILNSKKIPNTRVALRRVATMMKSYEEAGVSIPAERAVDMVMADYQTEFGELLDGAGPDQLEAFLGKERMTKLAKSISQWALARLKGGNMKQPTSDTTQDITKARGPDTKKMTPGDFTRFIGGIK